MLLQKEEFENGRLEGVIIVVADILIVIVVASGAVFGGCEGGRQDEVEQLVLEVWPCGCRCRRQNGAHLVFVCLLLYYTRDLEFRFIHIPVDPIME